jgi:hypothetical protein
MAELGLENMISSGLGPVQVFCQAGEEPGFYLQRSGVPHDFSVDKKTALVQIQIRI